MRKFLSVIIMFLIFVIPFSLEAATLSLSPNNTQTSVGGTVRVSIVASSPGQAVNAVSGTISFPKDKLQLTSISKDGSIINLWAAEPNFSNAQGTATFEGVILNSFNGSYGQIVTLVFKVIAVGEAPITFSSASVLASDGEGTNVLTSTSNTNISINTEAVKPVPIPQPKKYVEEEPVVPKDLEPEPEIIPILERVEKEPEIVVVDAFDFLSRYKEFGLKLVDAFSITIAIASLVFTFLCIVWYARLRIAHIRKRVKRELGIVDYSMHKALSQLHAEVTSHVKNIQKAKTKRELTAEEAVFMDRFEHRISHIESMLDSEMERIEKDMRKL